MSDPSERVDWMRIPRPTQAPQTIAVKNAKIKGEESPEFKKKIGITHKEVSDKNSRLSKIVIKCALVPIFTTTMEVYTQVNPIALLKTTTPRKRATPPNRLIILGFLS